jgi:hypothetical protein
MASTLAFKNLVALALENTLKRHGRDPIKPSGLLVGPVDQASQVQHLDPATTQVQNAVAFQRLQGNGSLRTADAAAGRDLLMGCDDDGTPV